MALFSAFVLISDAQTYSGKCGDNVNYALDTESGVLEITGTGAMKNYSNFSPAPWFFYSSSIKTVTISFGVTSIGDMAFYGCNSLTSITFLSPTTTIYDSSSTIPSSAKIYGYKDSTADAYAKKYGRIFIDISNPAVVAYQTTPVIDEKFDVRILVGVSTLDYQKVQFEVSMNGGTVVTQWVISVYEGIYGGDTLYRAETFGYPYLAVLTIKSVNAKTLSSIAVRPVAVTLDKDRIDGTAIELCYDGETDPVTSFPVFTVRKKED